MISEGYRNSLKNRIYGILCEFEKQGEWEKFLDSVIIELDGFPEDSRTINWYRLYHNLSSLRYLKYERFRAKIFESMSLLSDNEL